MKLEKDLKPNTTFICGADDDMGIYKFTTDGNKVFVSYYEYYKDDRPEEVNEYNSVEEAVKATPYNRDHEFMQSDDPKLQLTEDNLIQQLQLNSWDTEYIGNDITKASGPSFIAKNGTVINMKEIHDDLGYSVRNIGINLPTEAIGLAFSDGDTWNIDITDYVLEQLKWIKINDGLTDFDNRCYMVIRDNHITQQQFNQIMRWIEFVAKEKQSIEIIAKGSPPRVYGLDDPEAIQMKLLKYKNSGQLTEKMKFDFDNMDAEIVDGNFSLGSLVTVRINGKEYTRRVYDEPKVDLYIVVNGYKFYYQDFWKNKNESLEEDFHSELASEVSRAINNGGSLKLNTPYGYVLFTKPLDSDFGVTESDVVRVTYFDKEGNPQDHDIFDSFADATADFEESEYETLDEDFPDREHRVGHFMKHCVDGDPNEFTKDDYKNDLAYEAAANKLAHERVMSSDLNSMNTIVGFIQKDGAYVKYNKNTRGLVKFKPDTRFGGNVKIITYYKATPQRYQKIYNKEFGRDFKF